MIPKVFCWSKMGAEAGEQLERIICRKEVERRANDGVFTWGVGSSLGNSLDILREKHLEPPVVFTIMRSKAKPIDSDPKRLLLWMSYIDKSGVVQPLPKYCLLTSRGETCANKNKRNHYALICRANNAIDTGGWGEIDGSSLVNLKSGKNVGYSQVTSVVRKVPERRREPRNYQIGFIATLHDEGQVKLADYVEIRQKDLESVLEAADAGNVAAWKRAILDLKRGIGGSHYSHNVKAEKNRVPLTLDSALTT